MMASQGVIGGNMARNTRFYGNDKPTHILGLFLYFCVPPTFLIFDVLDIKY